MVIGIKDILKMVSIMIIVCCAVFVCTLFLNYNIDLVNIEDKIISLQQTAFYNAQITTCKMITAISGGCLLITSVIMLFFYIKYYIDNYRKELGILKALGYSNIKIAKSFWISGLSVFIGAVIGCLIAWIVMPSFYKVQNEDKILPQMLPQLHFILLSCLLLIPTLFFSLLSVFYSYHKLEMPVMDLLKEKTKTKVKVSNKITDLPFLDELKKSTVKQRPSLIFFICFAAFCYSDMIQMAFSMKDVASVFYAVMMIIIGIILAGVTQILATTTVVNANTKTIAMMKVFGYPIKQCTKSILGGYRIWAYIGFVLGTIYEYVLINIAINIVFKGIGDTPEYNFNLKAFIFTLVSFAVVYELIMYVYSRQIERISIKEVMIE